MALDLASLPIDADELQRHIEALGRVGDDPTSGRWLALYTPAWRTGIDLVRGWMEEAGLRTRQDAVGNLFGRLEGTEPGPAILSGSHIDTVPNGGRYDGQTGIHAALFAVKALAETRGTPRRTVEVVAIADEEGSRFASDYWGARAICGEIEPAELELKDANGVTLGEAMRGAGFDPDRLGAARRDDVATWLELHIEQGGTLEAEGLDIGVVHTITGLRQQKVHLRARQDHAGVTPMDVRVDAMAAAADIIKESLAYIRGLGRPAVCTTGSFEVLPGDASVVPGIVRFTQDMRDADPERYRQLCREVVRIGEECAARWGVQIEIEGQHDHAPIRMDASLQAVLQEQATRAGYRWKSMPSMAGHDAEIMAGHWQSAMLFVPSHDGRSHTPAEFTPVEQIVPGVRVLAATLHQLAY